MAKTKTNVRKSIYGWPNVVKKAQRHGGLQSKIQSKHVGGVYYAVTVNDVTVCRVPAGVEAAAVLRALKRALKTQDAQHCNLRLASWLAKPEVEGTLRDFIAIAAANEDVEITIESNVEQTPKAVVLRKAGQAEPLEFLGVPWYCSDAAVLRVIAEIEAEVSDEDPAELSEPEGGDQEGDPVATTTPSGTPDEHDEEPPGTPDLLNDPETEAQPAQ